MGLWVRAHATVKNMGSMGDSDAEKGGLLSLTYASPPEWDCPRGPYHKIYWVAVGLKSWSKKVPINNNSTHFVQDINICVALLDKYLANSQMVVSCSRMQWCCSILRIKMKTVHVCESILICTTADKP